MIDETFRGWQSVTNGNSSFAHCGQEAYWEGNQVFCSKCQEELTDDMFWQWLVQSPEVLTR